MDPLLDLLRVGILSPKLQRVSSPGSFNPGEKLVTQTSGTISFVGQVTKFDSQVSTGGGTTIVNGWNRDTGF